MASAGTPRAVSSLSSLYEIPRAYNGLYIWNFSQLIILLKKLFLREGTRMSKEMRCLIERHYSCYSRIPIIHLSLISVPVSTYGFHPTFQPFLLG